MTARKFWRMVARWPVNVALWDDRKFNLWGKYFERFKRSRFVK